MRGRERNIAISTTFGRADRGSALIATGGGSRNSTKPTEATRNSAETATAAATHGGTGSPSSQYRMSSKTAHYVTVRVSAP